MAIVDSRDDLAEKHARLLLLHTLVRHNIVKKLAARRVLHNDKNVRVSLDDIVDLGNNRQVSERGVSTRHADPHRHNIGMIEKLQEADLLLDTPHLTVILNDLLIDDLDGDLVDCWLEITPDPKRLCTFSPVALSKASLTFPYVPWPIVLSRRYLPIIEGSAASAPFFLESSLATSPARRGCRGSPNM